MVVNKFGYLLDTVRAWEWLAVYSPLQSRNVCSHYGGPLFLFGNIRFIQPLPCIEIGRCEGRRGRERVVRERGGERGGGRERERGGERERETDRQTDRQTDRDSSVHAACINSFACLLVRLFIKSFCHHRTDCLMYGLLKNQEKEFQLYSRLPICPSQPNLIKNEGLRQWPAVFISLPAYFTKSNKKYVYKRTDYTKT